MGSMEDLVLLARKGDQEAISELYEKTYNSVYQSVRVIMKDEEEALDVVQDSYIKGFQNLDKLEDPEKYQAWMKQIAANQARDYLRKKRPVLFSERVNQEGEELDLQHPDDCLEHMPDAVIDRQETTRLMNDILSTLSEEQRLAVVMHYYEQISIREIAETLNCSENTVKSRLNYGRKKIEAAVKALEKQGTKLYSLAPLPFFLWLLRMAKGYGISAQVVAGTTAAGAAGVAAAAGETAAAASGGSTAGSAAAGAAAKTAGSAAGKALATKIVAGTLAATITVGAGAAVVNHNNLEKENEAAHIVYEDVLDRYRYMAELDYEERFDVMREFWDEVLVSTLEKYPDEAQTVTMDKSYIQGSSLHAYPLQEGEEWDYEKRFDFKWGDDWEAGIPMPESMYFPTMRMDMQLVHWIAEDGTEFSTTYKMYYAIKDVNGDGIDDLILYGECEMPDGEYHFEDGWVHLHFAKDGNLYAAEVRRRVTEDGETQWMLFPVGEGNWWEINGRSYYLAVNPPSKEEFPRGEVIPDPELEWLELLSD